MFLSRSLGFGARTNFVSSVGTNIILSQARARLKKSTDLAAVSSRLFARRHFACTARRGNIRKSVPNNCALYDGIELAVKPLCTHAHGNPFRNAPIISLCTPRRRGKMMHYSIYSIIMYKYVSAFNVFFFFSACPPSRETSTRGAGVVFFFSTKPLLGPPSLTLPPQQHRRAAP